MAAKGCAHRGREKIQNNDNRADIPMNETNFMYEGPEVQLHLLSFYFQIEP